MKVTLKTKLEKLSGGYAWRILRIPRSVLAKLGIKGNTRRVVCTLDGKVSYQCGLMPDGNGEFFITVNKKLRDELGVTDGDLVRVELTKDESKYGLPMPDELAEVMRQDAEGDRMFHALTPGNQRLMIRVVSAFTDVDRRIHRALTLIEHLRKNDGRLVYDELHNTLKRRID